MGAQWIVAAVAIAAAWLLALAARRKPQKPADFFGGADETQVSVPVWGALLFVAMVLGILARYYWDLLGRGTGNEIDLGQMIRPLLVSPLVFFPVWSQTSGAPRTLTTVLVAFQNGFFWQAVFERQEAAQGGVS